MSRFRIAFLGTPQFAVESLRGLLRDEHFEVVGVVTQPDRPAGRSMKLTPSPVKLVAQEHGLPILTPETVNGPETLEQIIRWRAEVGVVVAFGQILSPSLLAAFPLGCVNIHGSVLPRWRGAAPIQRALMAGDAESGVALQKVVKKLDAGDVIGIRRVVIDDQMDARSLHDQLKVLGADLLHVELMDYLRGNLVPTPQDESLVTIAPKLTKLEAEIHWQHSARQIFNQVRGLTMGPVCWTRGRDGLQIKVWQSAVVEEKSQGQAGRIQSVASDGIIVECGRGTLKLIEVQPESKGRMNALDYVRGYGVQPGIVFGAQYVAP